ncbi:MAG: helix-turn-helix domain-containing protein, partial [Alphaproteobacteria bacterium]|nr:helix-turn-helix domain-containing protein [Alphaproteobacteria bacterium]MBM3734365.1 helix-turn-helix domain-containing protein [Acidobacteriota bacterium]MBM3735125.1 helix-turn-helix domain-containing protein [Acidobacteriota bacterium]MBM3735830.1 helix-turn-helix domain-containing protein [Acidobacteriota bacterium]MBM3735899.1 helix-turn-helix domain-containing protein [Acidobacteriota bacterium]
MPWREVSRMDSKVEFIEDWQANDLSFSELCRKHGISRQTGYTLVDRFRVEGWDGLQERSRAPHHSPAAMEEGTREELIELRMQ